MAGGLAGFSSGLHVTNRWSSRLRGRLGLGMQPRKEPWPLDVVGGAAQLHVMFKWARVAVLALLQATDPS